MPSVPVSPGEYSKRRKKALEVISKADPAVKAKLKDMYGKPTTKPAMGKPTKPIAPVVRPGKPSTMPVDDSNLFRKLPITEKDLKVIKKFYGIK